MPPPSSSFAIIDFRVDLSSPLWLIAVCPGIMFSLILVLYAFEGRGALYWPTVSETSADTNQIWSEKVFVMVAVLALVTRTICFIFFAAFRDLSFVLKLGMLALTATTFFSQAMLGSYPVDRDPARHSVYATTLFAAGILLKVFVSAAFFRRGGGRILAYRLAIIACEAGGLLFTAHSDRFVSHRAEDSVSAAGEWAYVALGMAFWASLRRDLAEVTVGGIIATDLPGL
jgi:hypothetical protein